MSRAGAAGLTSALMLAASAHAALPPGATQADSAATGKLRFAAAAPGEFLNAAPPASGATAADTGKAFLTAEASSFGLQGSELSVKGTSALPDGGRDVRYQQTIGGVAVLGGEFHVHLDAGNNVVTVTGEAEPDTTVDTTPAITVEQARATALAAVPGTGLKATDEGLRVYEDRLLGGDDARTPALVRAIEVTNGFDVRKLVLVDAHRGVVAHTIDEIDGAVVVGGGGADPTKSRRICDGENHNDRQIPCSDPVLTEGGSYTGSVADVTPAYDYLGATYDYYFSRFGRNSIDNRGLRLDATVRACQDGYECPLENAFWNGDQMIFGDGWAGADDVVGHELTHGVTQHTSGLVYENQSGAINESLSDIFGELIDQATASPDDGNGDLWEIGESLPDGALRDMADPGRFGDPDSTTSPRFITEPHEEGENDDQGGVHTNSGVGNHAAYLMAHGGGQVSAIGLEKTARIFYQVETAYLTSGSDYADLGWSLRSACDDMVGTHGITRRDCLQVRYAVLATAMAEPEELDARIELPAGGVRAGVPFFVSGEGSVPSTGPIASYAWTFSDGATAGGSNPSHTFAAPGRATATLVVTDREGETSSATVSFVVRRADSAFVDLPGCASNALAPNDDGSTGAVDLPFALNFFGTDVNTLYVNNNGNVTFDSPLATYTPFDLTGTTGRPIIAPFFADIDTRDSGSDVVTLRQGDVRRPAGVLRQLASTSATTRRTPTSSTRFQLLLVDRSDTARATSTSSSTTTRSSGRPATRQRRQRRPRRVAGRAGFANGTQADGTTFELPGSATPGAFLDGAPTGLARTSLNSTVPGPLRVLRPQRPDAGHRPHPRPGPEPRSGRRRARAGVPARHQPVHHHPQRQHRVVLRHRPR